MSIVLASVIDIDATPARTWEVLADFSRYGEWSNFSRVEGTAELGTRLRMRMPGMSFRPTVTAAVPHEELQWSARIMTEGVFLAQHTFRLVPNDDGTTRVHNTEVFSGALTKPFTRLCAHRGDDGYVAFNRALRDRVER